MLIIIFALKVAYFRGNINSDIDVDDGTGDNGWVLAFDDDVSHVSAALLLEKQIKFVYEFQYEYMRNYKRVLCR